MQHVYRVTSLNGLVFFKHWAFIANRHFASQAFIFRVHETGITRFHHSVRCQQWLSYGAFKGTCISSLLFRKRQVSLLCFFNLDFVRRSLFLCRSLFFKLLTFFTALHNFFRCSLVSTPHFSVYVLSFSIFLFSCFLVFFSVLVVSWNEVLPLSTGNMASG